MKSSTARKGLIVTAAVCGFFVLLILINLAQCVVQSQSDSPRHSYLAGCEVFMGSDWTPPQ